MDQSSIVSRMNCPWASLPTLLMNRGGNAESLQVPGNVERRTAEHFTAVRKTVKQDFAEDQRH